MSKLLLFVVGSALFAASLAGGVTLARFTTQQQESQGLQLAGSNFQVTIGGCCTLPLVANGFRPGGSKNEDFTASLAAAPEINAAMSFTLVVPIPAPGQDSSPNGNNGTLLNGASTVIDSGDDALALDGVNDYMRVPHSASINVTGANLTIEAWIKPQAGTGNAMLMNKLGSYSVHRRSDGTITYADGALWSYDTFGFHGNTPVDVWSHVAVVRDGVTARLYINGLLAANLPWVGNIPGDTEELAIGSNSGFSSTLKGRMDEVRVWAAARTQAQIQAGMVEGTITGTEAGLRGYWSFNQALPAFAYRLQGELKRSGTTVWGPDALANMVTESPVFFGILPGGGSTPLNLTVTWPNGTPEQENPFKGATFSGDVAVDAVQVTGSLLNSCTDTQGKTTLSLNSVTFSGGAAPPTWGDPACTSTRVYSRMTGLYTDFAVTPLLPATSFAVGFHSGGPLSTFQHALLFHSDGKLYSGDVVALGSLPGAAPILGTWTAGEPYRVRVVLKELGGATYQIQGLGFAAIGGPRGRRLHHRPPALQPPSRRPSPALARH